MRSISDEEILSFVEQTPVAMCVLEGPGHVFRMTNRLYMPLLGGRDVIGMKLRLALPELAGHGFYEALDQVYQTGVTFKGDGTAVTLIRADGSPRLAHLNLVFQAWRKADGTIKGVMIGATDVSEQFDIREALAETENRFREANEQLGLALESAQMGTWHFDLKTLRMTTLDGAQAIFGVAQIEENIFEFIDRLVLAEDREEVRRVWQESIATQSPYSHEFRLVRPDGVVRWIFSRGTTKLGADGKPAYFSGVLGNITERRAVEAALVVESRKLEVTIMDLERERELRERFVMALTHDLRTPLSAAKLSAQLAHRKADIPSAVEVLSDRVVVNMDRADRMIRDLLDASRIKAGEGIPLKFEECRLDQVVDTAVRDLRQIHGPRFELQDQVGAITGCWDPTGLPRVIENLAGNAIKYGATHSQVTITTALRGDFAEISVHNEGNAISPEDQKTLFEPFQRTESAWTGGQKGWGIGLTIVKSITEAHGGTVRVESEPQRGTTFYVRLPLERKGASA